MAAPTYTTDLQVLSLADTVTGWSEPTGATAGGAQTLETDYFLQGTNCITKTMNATGLAGLAYTNGTNITFTGDTVFYIWNFHGAPNSISTKALGGVQVIVGSSAAAYYRYYVSGSDTYTYGGWINYVVNPNFTPRSGTAQGTPAGTWNTFGIVLNNLQALGQGRPFAVDAIRYGRGTIQAINGDLANGYATFIGMSVQNDLLANRWGILQNVDGQFKYQGHLLLGITATAVDFRDSNRTLIIQNTEFVTANFNLIEIRNAASIVQWTGISIASLGIVSKGRLLVTDNATITIDNCTFTDMDTFVLQSNTDVLDSTFRRCGLITQGGATFDQCEFDQPTATAGVLVNAPSDLALITNSTFVSDGTGHAIELTGTASDCTLDAITFTGYATTNGSTGNETIFVNIATGSLTINIINGGNTPSIRTAGATVTVSNSKTFTVTNIIENTEVRLVRQSDLVEIAGAEVVGASPSGLSNVSVTTDPNNSGRFKLSYSYNYTVDIPLFVVIFNEAYEALYLNSTLIASDSSLSVFQTLDRQYSRGTIFNPT